MEETRIIRNPTTEDWATPENWANFLAETGVSDNTVLMEIYSNRPEHVFHQGALIAARERGLDLQHNWITDALSDTST